MNQKKNLSIPLVAVLLAATSVAATAAPTVPIIIQSAQYDTWVMRGRLQDPDPTREERPMSSPFPISDSLMYGDHVEAKAEADLFRVHTLAHAAVREDEDPFPRRRSGASASSEFIFSPQILSVADMRLDFLAWGNFAYGGGSVNLLDLTAGLELHAYNYDGLATLGWSDGPELGTKINSLMWDSISLIPGHDYKLTISSWSASNVPDADSRLTRLYGFEVVPEPSVLALFTLAATALFAVKRRQP